MDVDFIFKIAAIGIIVTVLNLVLTLRKRGTGNAYHPCGTCGGAFNGG